jgi:hypothetical protein
MDSCAFELDSLLFSDRHIVHCGHREAVLGLAGKLRGGDGAIINLVDAIRNRRLHDNVGGCRSKKCGSCHNG